MAARALHFGWDDCYRVRVLERAGYAVTVAENLVALELNLQRGEPVDLVVVSEDTPRTTEHAADIVRQRTKVPVILFRRSALDLDESKFDQVFAGFLSPEIWLARTAELIEQSRQLRESSERLRHESEAVRLESQRLRAQFRQELARTRPKPTE